MSKYYKTIRSEYSYSTALKMHLITLQYLDIKLSTILIQLVSVLYTDPTQIWQTDKWARLPVSYVGMAHKATV